MSLRNYIDKLNRYFWFSKEEQLHFLIVVGIFALIASWNDWGETTFDAARGLWNLLLGIIFMALTVFVHHAGQRLMALFVNFRAEQRIWWHGLLISLILTILSGGTIQIFAGTGTLAYLLPAHRLGALRYGTNLSTISKIMLAGPLANILFAGLAKSLEWLGILGSIGNELFVINLWFAGINLLPIPPLDGAKVFFASRLTYLFIASTILGYLGLIAFLNIYSYLFALLIGITCWFIYYLTFEREWS